ncbi:MAG: DNA polymerase III subunit epsilon [Actinobacteria bacterium]|nr:DNA polymerase III subunit epsilon [Actinomycetota bacterium]NBY15032.1 DNA polymerase III subunit epsilon [Actinomycetota bacterium]
MIEFPLRFAQPDYLEHFVHYGNFAGQAPLQHTADYVVVDVETSGLDPKAGARVIEIAAIRTPGNGTVTDSFHTLINPQSSDVGLTALHGITASMVSDAPTFAEVSEKLKQMFAGCIFVAHHALFDERFVASEFARAGTELPVMPGTCTYWMSRAVTSGTENHKLGTLTTHYGLNSGLAHSALSDAMVVVQMLPHLLAKMDHPGHYVPLSPEISAEIIVPTKYR